MLLRADEQWLGSLVGGVSVACEVRPSLCDRGHGFVDVPWRPSLRPRQACEVRPGRILRIAFQSDAWGLSTAW